MSDVPVLTIDGPSGSGKGTVSRAVLDDLFRHFHSLKGISGMVELRAAEELAHRLEDYLRASELKVTDEDRKKNRYYDHMAGLTGVVENVYGKEEIAVKIDQDSLSDVTRKVHLEATKRMLAAQVAARG